MIQSLEPRRLLTLAVSLDAGTLLVKGTNAADTIAVQQSGDMVVVNLNTATFSVPAAEVTRISVKSMGGDDIITIADSITVQSNLFGGAGNDVLSAGPSGSKLYGEGGNDTLAGGRGRDNIYGGLGVDTVDYSTRTDPLRISLDGKANDGAPASGVAQAEKDNLAADLENVIGGTGDDLLIGSEGKNVLQGNAGNDTLNGAGGDDVLVGGAGNDSLLGGLGDDVFVAIDANSNDTLDGGDGFDSAALDSVQGIKDTLLNVEAQVSVFET